MEQYLEVEFPKSKKEQLTLALTLTAYKTAFKTNTQEMHLTLCG